MKFIFSVLAAAVVIYASCVFLHSFVTFSLEAVWIGDWQPISRALYIFFSFAGGTFIHDIKFCGGESTREGLRVYVEESDKSKIN